MEQEYMTMQINDLDELANNFGTKQKIQSIKNYGTKQ